jgi:FlaA1/EpsC-like NDP-sugar epimerase
MIIQAMSQIPVCITDFVAVRFGNVLGSNGSVIPIFMNQIENGGPVTITDKRIIRYFMTVSEAASLVLKATVIAKNSEIFVLDMGKPVKIISLAENLIRLAGLKPYKDIQIIETGLRPGEKLYEELLVANDTVIATSAEKIFIEKQSDNIKISDNEKGINLLYNAVEIEDDELIMNALKKLVPTYKCPEEVNSCVEEIVIAKKAVSCSA